MKKFVFLFAGSLLGIIALYNACVKPPDYPREPVIEFMSKSKTEMKQGKQGQDSVAIRFSYTDGDGDLGFPGTDGQSSIFIKDGRDSFPKYQYKLPYVEPQGTGNGISGDITIVVPTTCCISYTPQGQILACDDVQILRDTVFYLITIRDRAGNISNEISSGPITLICK